ncbi:MAG: hypothetical protein IJ053_03780 [Lachnospiraceae bacterium]|nr:hypothetical protein [Lachnospiraceae bacterium]
MAKNKAKRCLSFFLIFLMMFVGLQFDYSNIIAADMSDIEALKEDIMTTAADYLGDTRNPDGSFDYTATINNTAEACAVLREFTDIDVTQSLSWLEEKEYQLNTDTLSRMSVAFDDGNILKIIDAQNTDGGIGLRKDFKSNIHDSVLALDAINYSEENLYPGESWRLVNYIVRQMNSDGSYSYDKASDGDVILSSMALYNVSKYVTDNNLKSDIISDMMKKTGTYISDCFDSSFPEEKIEENLYIALALQEMNLLEGQEEIVNTLHDIQSDNGSFYNDVHLTSLVIRLLGSMDISHMISIYDMEITDTYEAYYGTDTDIEIPYVISYDAKADVEYQIKCIITNGTNKIYESDIQTISLIQGQGTINGKFEDIVINEDKDDGIFITLQLLYEDKIIKEAVSIISMTNYPREYRTYIDGFSLESDSYYTFVNKPADVSVKYKILYTTNIEKEVEIRITLAKDENIILDETYSEIMMPEAEFISTSALSFTPDVSDKGRYIITADCIYQGEVIEEKIVEFNIIDYETIIEPRLSEYVVYAGRENLINVSMDIYYNADDDFNGKVVAEVTKDGEQIGIYEADVNISPSEEIYKMDDVLDFKAVEEGQYAVTTTLYNSEGIEISSGTRTVQVIEKNKIDFISVSSINDTESMTVDISWNDISTAQDIYNYRLHRRFYGNDWEVRSIWNQNSRIKVLEIYPYESYLGLWMNSEFDNDDGTPGLGMFDVDSVHLDDYNSEPEKYMKDENGDWLYDVIFFGACDFNNYRDLSDDAYEVTDEFVNSGRGALFGHDTVCTALGHSVFAKFGDRLGMRLYAHRATYIGSSVSVVKIGTLTNFPWKLRGTLDIPYTHSFGQYIGGQQRAVEWMHINTRVYEYDRETGEHENGYLTTCNNLAMIQTGHSTGQASDDERKVFANTLFYLYQTSSHATNAKDNSFYDLTSPEIPRVSFAGVAGNTISFDISSTDNGTKYQYYVEAVSSTDDVTANERSNIMTETATSGIKGYVYCLSTSPDKDTSILEYDENDEVVLNVVSADSAGILNTSLEIPDGYDRYYLHVYAVDNENNVSDEKIIPLDEGTLTTDISTDKKEYYEDDTVEINSTTSTIPYKAGGDVSLYLYDGEGNYLEEIFYENSQMVSADNPYIISTDIDLNGTYNGTYKLKVEWNNAGKVLCYADTEFEVIKRRNEINDNGTTEATEKKEDETPPDSSKKSTSADDGNRENDTGANIEITTEKVTDANIKSNTGATTETGRDYADYGVPDTGDTSYIFRYFIMKVLSLILLAIVIWRIRKDDK